MDDKEKLKLLISGSRELGVSLSEAQAGSLLIYLRELKLWNKKINLTAIEDDKNIIIKHFLDSLSPVRCLAGINSILDMGSGGGFPGIPLKIALPEVRFTLLDTVEKKVYFMRHIIRTIGLKEIEAISGRAESPELAYKLGNSFDCVMSRAFSELEPFITLAMPYLKPGGMILAMKGPAVKDELGSLGDIKGLSKPEVQEVAIPFSERVTSLVVFRKI